MRSYIDYEVECDNLYCHLSNDEIPHDYEWKKTGGCCMLAHALMELYLTNKREREIYNRINVNINELGMLDDQEWSMMNDSVINNAEVFNDQMQLTNWDQYVEDAYPISWRRNEWIDVIETIIEGVY